MARSRRYKAVDDTPLLGEICRPPGFDVNQHRWPSRIRRIRRARVLAGVLAICGLLALPGAAVAKGRQVLAVFKGTPYDYELALPKCTASKDWGSFRGTPRCPFEVRVLEKEKAVAVKQLDVASCGPPKPGAPDQMMGADPEASVWVTGYDRCRADVAART